MPARYATIRRGDDTTRDGRADGLKGSYPRQTLRLRIAFLLFLYGLVALIAPVPYAGIVVLVSAALLLLGTTVF